MERIYVQELLDRLSEKRRFIQVLLGPRQVGKTTIIKQLTKKLTIPHLFISADESLDSDGVWIEQQWQSLRLRMDTQNWSEAVLIIDEIQRIHDWSLVVKKLWDEDSFQDRSLKVVLWGSAKIVLQKGITESLAGRFEEWFIPHWSFSEMKQAFNWDASTYAWFGGYPESADLIKDETRWKDYVRNSLIETVLSKDVFMLNSIQKPALFRNLFELACTYSGNIVSYTKLLGQLTDAGNTTTLTHYQTLLESAGLVSGLEKYSPNLIRQRSSSPKWQIHNMALMSSMSSKTFMDIQSDFVAWGHVIESVIGTHLMSAYQKGAIELFYWRDGNDEVDFVIKKGEKISGIELKSGQKKSNRGMGAFKNKFPEAKTILVGISGIPWQEFLENEPEVYL